MITKEKTLDLLDTLHEHKMAKEIFVPLLVKMGLKGVRYTGGTEEFGIDVEYYELTEPEGNKSYVGIQFKKGDLVYSSTGAKGSVKDVKNQAEEAFEKEIHDLDGRGTHFISRFIVATTGDINDKARQYIGKARLKGSDRRIDYWTGDRLAEYIQNFWEEEFKAYFPSESSEDEEVTSPMVDAEYIEDNYGELIDTCRKVKRTVSNLEWEILYTVFELRARTGHNPSMADLLMELGKPEDYYYDEFRQLSRLEYIDEGNGCLSLSGHASSLLQLYENILSELDEADEGTTDPMSIIQEIIG